MSDSPFLKRILLHVCRGPVRLFRSNNGVGWVGKTERFARRTAVVVEPGDVVIRQARPLHAGLQTGAGDLIGWKSRVIQPEDVGTRVAVFVSLEAKEGTGRLTAEQRNWRDQVRAAGGIAEEVRTLEDAAQAVA